MSNEKMSDLARQKRNEYHRKWQRQNPEKVQQAQQKFWEKKAQEEQKGDD